MIEGVQQGAIELLVTSTGPLGGFSPSINILDFPFLFRDFNHVDLVMDGSIAANCWTTLGKSTYKVWLSGKTGSAI